MGVRQRVRKLRSHKPANASTAVYYLIGLVFLLTFATLGTVIAFIAVGMPFEVVISTLVVGILVWFFTIFGMLAKAASRLAPFLNMYDLALTAPEGKTDRMQVSWNREYKILGEYRVPGKTVMGVPVPGLTSIYYLAELFSPDGYQTSAGELMHKLQVVLPAELEACITLKSMALVSLNLPVTGAAVPLFDVDIYKYVYDKEKRFVGEKIPVGWLSNSWWHVKQRQAGLGIMMPTREIIEQVTTNAAEKQNYLLQMEIANLKTVNEGLSDEVVRRTDAQKKESSKIVESMKIVMEEPILPGWNRKWVLMAITAMLAFATVGLLYLAGVL